MKRGQTNIALVLLGIVAIVALIGLILLVKKTPTGAVYGGQVLWSGPLKWENVFGWMPNFESESWCKYNKIADGGFLDVLQQQGEGNYRCYAVPPESVPHLYRTYNERYPIACFAEGTLVVSPEIKSKLPLECKPPQWAYDPFPYQGQESPYWGPTWN
jgi:hypothetical protein